MDVRRYPSKILPIDSIVPYWRNPRRVTDEAVNALAKSIEEFGYKQPIVVDTENVIVIGHTRYAAMRRLGVTEVEVKVVDLPPAKAKQLRIVDNRVAEFTSWDFDALSQEIEDLDSELVHAFFPEITGAQGQAILDLSQAPEAVEGRPWDQVDPMVDLICPGCFHSFSLKVSREELLAGSVLGAVEKEASA